MKYQPFKPLLLIFKRLIPLVSVWAFFYFMIFLCIKFKRKEEFAATYKITFDNKCFYIGSSYKVRRRMRRWQCMFNHPDKFLKNINIKNIIPHSKVATFEIIKVYKTPSLIRKAETG